MRTFPTPAAGGASSSGVAGKVNYSDGAGGFSSDPLFSFDSAAKKLELGETAGLSVGEDTGSGAATMGIATLDASGLAAILTTAITANSRVFLTAQSSSASSPTGLIYEQQGSRVPGTGFGIESSAGIGDRNVDVAWIFFEPA